MCVCVFGEACIAVLFIAATCVLQMPLNPNQPSIHPACSTSSLTPAPWQPSAVHMEPNNSAKTVHDHFNSISMSSLLRIGHCVPDLLIFCFLCLGYSGCSDDPQRQYFEGRFLLRFLCFWEGHLCNYLWCVERDVEPYRSQVGRKRSF